MSQGSGATVLRMQVRGGALLRVTAFPFIIGRRLDVDLRFADDPSMGRQNTELSLGGVGVIWLRDLGSSNGTRINGAKVARHRLEVGDSIQPGHQEIEVLSISVEVSC